MKQRTQIILTVMNVVAWLALVGLVIKMGSILISYGVSVENPEGAKNLYNGLNLYNIRQYDFWQYTGSVFLLVAILAFEAYTAFLITRVLTKVKIKNPFTVEVSKIIEKIGYIILWTWVIAAISNGHTTWLSRKLSGLQENLALDEFLLLAGVVFVFSQIFKRGVEIQSENELTV